MQFFKIDSGKAMILWAEVRKVFFLKVTKNCVYLCLCKAVTSKQIEQESPSCSQINGIEKSFPDLMQFFKIDSGKAVILWSEVRRVLFFYEKQRNCVQLCLCRAVTSKRIELESRGCSQINGIEKSFPDLMQFLKIDSGKAVILWSEVRRVLFFKSNKEIVFSSAFVKP